MLEQENTARYDLEDLEDMRNFYTKMTNKVALCCRAINAMRKYGFIAHRDKAMKKPDIKLGMLAEN